jgi:methylenetetrahydrofolate dehydrogenase (NADP+)/methenyltetrahydrofolate cyclohydrolase
METRILDGEALAQKVNQGIRSAIKAKGLKPGLAVILVGDDPASMLYVQKKEECCESVGVRSFFHRLPCSVTQRELLELIQRLNNDPDVDGILVQLPLPKGLDATELLDAIDPDKDVDGFHPTTMGRLVEGREEISPCTPKGVMRILDEYQIPVEGKEVVIVGASNIVGKPLAMMMVNRMATVTICHIKTRDLSVHTKKAEILCSATGVPHLITPELVMPGAVVIDIGISRWRGRTVGDADTEGLMGLVSAITPVPGGIGPMTVAMLMENTLLLHCKRHGVALDWS